MEDIRLENYTQLQILSDKLDEAGIDYDFMTYGSMAEITYESPMSRSTTTMSEYAIDSDYGSLVQGIEVSGDMAEEVYGGLGTELTADEVFSDLQEYHQGELQKLAERQAYLNSPKTQEEAALEVQFHEAAQTAVQAANYKEAGRSLNEMDKIRFVLGRDNERYPVLNEYEQVKDVKEKAQNMERLSGKVAEANLQTKKGIMNAGILANASQYSDMHSFGMIMGEIMEGLEETVNRLKTLSEEIQSAMTENGRNYLPEDLATLDTVMANLEEKTNTLSVVAESCRVYKNGLGHQQVNEAGEIQSTKEFQMAEEVLETFETYARDNMFADLRDTSLQARENDITADKGRADVIHEEAENISFAEWAANR